MESKSSARLAWDIKRYDVLTPKKERKRVLHATSHAVYGGELFLILGPSGSGKTSLVTILAGRNATGSWSGALLAEGAPAGRGPRRSTGFVDQQPLFFSTLTRLKGISGGEKKRLQIAAELVSDPNTLVLDEPTSGLDAATALLTVRSVSRIANDGAKAVVAVVHQPRAALMLLFDMALVLSEGRPAYSGHPGDELLRHFSTLELEPPAHDNPADFVMDLVAVPDEIFETDAESVAALDLRKRDRTRFDVLARRAFTYKFRDEMVVVTQVSMALIMAVLLGAIYYDLGLGQESVQNRVGAVSFSMLLMSFIAFDVVLLFPKERDLYKREHAAGLYCPSAFFHARCVAELPGHLVAGGCYATVTYWMMGFQQDLGKFLSYVALCEALVLSGTSLLIACGCLAKDFEGANNIATVAYCLFMMFDGHYINNKSIPEGARWIKQLNFFNWGISAAARSELKGLGEMHGCRDPASQKCVFQRGDDAADYYGYHQTVREALAALALICVVMRFLGFLAFKYFFQDHPLFAPKPIPDDLPPEPAPEPAAPAPEDGPEDLEEPAEPPLDGLSGRDACGFVHVGEAETSYPTSSSATSPRRTGPRRRSSTRRRTIMPMASKSCENLIDLMPLPGLRPVSLALVESGVNEANAKQALENLRFVVSADVDAALRTATATEQVLERKDGAHNQYGLSEWLVVVAVGAAWTATPTLHLSSGSSSGTRRSPLDDFKREQRRTLEALRERASRDAWREIHALHFDWWMFPIEDGRRAGFNVLEADAAELGADLAWRAGYVEGVELVCRAWGWDAKAAEPLGAKHDDQTWSWWDVRLAKMIRSLWLFEEDALLLSLQKLARTIKPDGGFRYGTVNLDEILYMAPTLPLLRDDRPRRRSWRARSEDQQP
ncbi:ATPase [Aureococcus anophagefferens]|nr:ATPase [Aureococcus anophagefferens]